MRGSEDAHGDRPPLRSYVRGRLARFGRPDARGIVGESAVAWIELSMSSR